MPSKRGRKRNDNLPPNRARDVQRAFRARRATHLQALEQRVAELEEENGQYRQALNLPPSNRSPLGKGPTGKDNPKPPHTSCPSISTNPTPDTSPVLPSLSLLTLSTPAKNPKSRPSPSESPSPLPTRTRSLSPSNFMSIPSQSFRKTSSTLPGLEIGSSWDHPRTLPPPDRQQPVREQYDEPHLVLCDVREERQHYSFSQPSFPSPHDGSLHSPVQRDTSQMNSTALSQRRDQMSSTQQQQQSFTHRRSITDPQGFRGFINTFPNLPGPQTQTQPRRMI